MFVEKTPSVICFANATSLKREAFGRSRTPAPTNSIRNRTEDARVNGVRPRDGRLVPYNVDRKQALFQQSLKIGTLTDGVEIGTI